MSNVLAAIVIFAFGAALGAVLVWRLGQPEPREIVRTDTVRVEEQIPDTVTVTKPDTRIIYQTVTDTVREYVTLPVGFRPGGIIGREPLRVTPQTITLTYWQPDASRFEQAVYDVPRPRWKVWTEGTLMLTPVGTMLGVMPGVTFEDRWNVFGGILAVEGQNLTLGWAAGVRYRFTIFER